MTAKLVLVTGASSGIGAAVSKRFGRDGAHVLLLARNPERLDRAAHDVRDAGGTATPFAVDLQNAEETLDAAARIADEIGTLTFSSTARALAAGALLWRPVPKKQST